MDDKHFLSVIVPLYNSESWVEDCIKSIAKLTPRKEIIVVDDGSTDHSAERIEKFANDGTIRLIHQQNKGVSEARNAALAACHGDIVAFVDSDDLIVPDEFERFYRHFTASAADMAMGSVRIVFPDREDELRCPTEHLRGHIIDGQHCFAELMRSDTFTPLTVGYLFRKKWIDTHGLSFRHRMSEDDLWTSTAMCLAKRVLVDKGAPHYVYCKREGSITESNKSTRLRADSHMAVASDLYHFMRAQQLSEEAQTWMCCKILYILSSSIVTYAAIGHYDFDIDTETIRDILNRIKQTAEPRPQKIAYIYTKRIADTLRKHLDKPIAD